MSYDEKNKPFEHLVNWLCEQHEFFDKSTYRQEKIKKAKESRQVYDQQAQMVVEPWEGAANITLPLVAITVDNMEPRLAAGLVGQRPFVKLEIDGRQQLNPVEEAVQGWWDNELEDVVKAEDVASQLCHDVLLDGTVFVLPKYDLTEKTVRRIQTVDPQLMQAGMAQLQQLSQMAPEQMPPELQQEAVTLAQNMQAMSQNVKGIMVDQSGKPIFKDEVVKEFEGGKVEFLNLNSVYMPDNVDDDTYEDALIMRDVDYTYAELMRDSQDESQSGWNKENVNSELLGEEDKDQKLEAEEQNPAQSVADVVVSGKKVIPCLECYCSYMYREPHEREDEATDFTEERLVVLLSKDTKRLLRLRLLREINPQNNHIIRRVTLFRERGESLGKSIAEKMVSIQDGASRAFNLAINTGEIQLLPWGFYDGKAGLQNLQGEKGQLQLGLGRMLKVDSVDGILFPTINGNYAGFVQLMEIWMQFWERAFNIGDLQIGRPKGDTATETLAVIQEGNISHNYRSKRSKAGFLGILQTLWDLYYAWMPLTQTITIEGQEIPFPREMMFRGTKLRLTSTTEMANKLIKRRENEDFATMTGVNQNPGLWNQVKVAEDLAKSYEKDNPKEYVNPALAQVNAMALAAPDVIPAMIAAGQQAMQLAQQIQQGGEQEAQQGMANEVQARTPGPATGEEMAPKFAPRPQDAVKKLAV